MTTEFRVLRTQDCKHPSLSDADLIAYAYAFAAGYTMETPFCPDCNGYWYPRENSDGDIVLSDEPVGAGL